MMNSITTLRKQIAEQKKSLNLFDIVLQNIDDGISVQDTSGSIIYENIHARRMHSKLFTLHSKITDEQGVVVPYTSLPPFLTLGDARIHKIIVEVNKNIKQPSIWIRVKSVPVFDADEQLVYVVSTWRDITGRILEEKRRDHFIAIGSHELRTPLAGIKVLNQALHKFYLEQKYDKAHDFFYKIDLKVNQLTKIIHDFIEVEKIRGNTLEFNPESFNIDAFVTSTIQDLQSIYPSHTIEKKGTADVTIIADKERLQEVFNNLIGNARKYSPLENRIVVTLSHDVKNITVAVQDYGIGLDNKYVTKIFQPFYRIKDAHNDKIRGLGLGLYIAYKIIELHGGKMWIKSRINKGSTFYFTLPIVIRKTRKSYDF